jgi:hypothetical protein
MERCHAEGSVVKGVAHRSAVVQDAAAFHTPHVIAAIARNVVRRIGTRHEPVAFEVIERLGDMLLCEIQETPGLTQVVCGHDGSSVESGVFWPACHRAFSISASVGGLTIVRACAAPASTVFDDEKSR